MADNMVLIVVVGLVAIVGIVALSVADTHEVKRPRELHIEMDTDGNAVGEAKRIYVGNLPPDPPPKPPPK